MWKWIAGLAGLGAVGYGVKRHMDRDPRAGDLATVPFASLTVPGLSAGAVNPLLAFGVGPIKVAVQLTAPNGVVSGIVGAGIPVAFKKEAIVVLSRNGVIVFGGTS